MLLAIDAGNTSINNAIFKNGRIIKRWRIENKVDISPAFMHAKYKGAFSNHKIEAVIVASVVPRLTRICSDVFKKSFNAKVKIVGKDIVVPVKNMYKNPKSVGQDRLVNAFAGYKKYGGGLIIIDFGTAITFDVISKKGSYLGGIIVPGIQISLEALSSKAALLPDITLKHPGELIGRDTITSMLSGMLHGYGSLCEGIIVKIRSCAKGRYKIILTGGQAKLMSRYFESYDSVNPDLTLQGLFLLYRLLT